MRSCLSLEVAGGDWQELTVPLDVEGRLIHLRVFMPDVKRPTKIEWIEIRASDGATKDRKRWDFTRPAKRATPKQKPKPAASHLTAAP